MPVKLFNLQLCVNVMLAIKSTKSAVYPTGIVDFAGWFQDYLALSLATYNSAYYIKPHP